MSHTSSIKAVTIVDIAALRAACNELQVKQGVKISLIENALPRSFYNENQENMGVAPYVVKLSDSRYDIGLYRTENNKGYEARFDMWGQDIAQQLGVPITKDETREQAAVGKLFNLYATHAVMRAAAANGQMVDRVTNQDGSTRLVINLAA